jgi:hypothetical protein
MTYTVMRAQYQRHRSELQKKAAQAVGGWISGHRPGGVSE